jgi:hypothetical protein
MLERFPGNLQKKALLRIEDFRFARRDAKKSGVEAVNRCLQEATPIDASLSRSPLGRVKSRVKPAIPGHLPYGFSPAGKEVPELGKALDASGEAATNADDGDFFGHERRSSVAEIPRRHRDASAQPSLLPSAPHVTVLD